MSSIGLPGGRPPATAGRPAPVLVAAAAVAVLGATLGWSTVGFGVLTDCTNQFDCTETLCAPCRSANAWLAGIPVAEGVVLVVVAGLAVVARGRRRARGTVRSVAWACMAVALVVLPVVAFAARQTY